MCEARTGGVSSESSSVTVAGGVMPALGSSVIFLTGDVIKSSSSRLLDCMGNGEGEGLFEGMG